MIIDRLPALPSAPTTGDELAIERGTEVYKTDFDAFINSLDVTIEQHIPSHVSDWLDEHVDPATGYVVDDTLSIRGAAADAAACGELKNNLDSAFDDFALIDSAGLTGINGYASYYRPMVINSTPRWSNSGNGTHILVPINSGDTISITANSSQNATYGILTNLDIPVHNATPFLSTATGFTNVISLTKRTSVTFTAPGDALFLYLTRTISTTTYTPDSVQVNGKDMFKSFHSDNDSILNELYATSVPVAEPAINGKFINNYGAIATGTGYSISPIIELPKSAYMVCVAGTVVDYSGISIVALYSDAEATNCVAKVIPTGGNVYLTIPENARYVCFCSNTKGGVTTPVRRYIVCQPKTLYDYEKPYDEYVITGTEYTPSFTDGQYIGSTGIYAGQIISIPAKPGFKTTDFIPLDSKCVCIVIRGSNLVTNAGILMIAFYEESNQTTFISGIAPNGEDIVAYVPPNAKYCIIGSNSTGGGVYYALEGEILFINDAASGSGSKSIVTRLESPASYDLVVGDTFELFYKGIISSTKSEDYFIDAACSIGTPYGRKFIVNPSSAGTYPLVLKLYDDKNMLNDYKSLNLIVHAAPTSPESNINILCVGDSLTVFGEWVKELKRRLTGSGGAPAGNNLSNITFIGTCEADGANYEGYGGYKFASYNTENISNDIKVITCTHDKTEALDQHSIYKDSNNAEWSLETIQSGSIKIILVSGSATNFPSSGTLNWVSGGENHSDIVYIASQNASGNPFWDSNESKVDFGTYATRLGVSSIDYVCVLLGWNSTTESEETYKANAQTFIDNVQDSFPNAKILLVGLEIPAQDGLARNYGATRPILSNYQKAMQYVFNLDNWYDDLVDDNTNVYHINLSGQFDTEYNMQTSTRPVNTRNATRITYQSNGVHPEESGYLQIADAVYRFLCGMI